MWSHMYDACLAMGHVNHPDGVDAAFLESGTGEMEVTGRRLPHTASLRPFYTARR